MSHAGIITDTPDLLVVGLGTTGVIALRAAREAGVGAVGVDIRPAPNNGSTDGAMFGVRAWGMFGDGTVVCSAATGTLRFQPRAVVIATGAVDLPLPLPGWERDGAMGAFRGARELPRGTEVVVLRGPYAGLGGRVPDLGHLDVIHDHRITDGQPIAIDGNDCVSTVSIGDTAMPATRVLLDNGLQPENVLARMTGIPTTFATAGGGDTIAPGSIVALQGTLLTVVGDAAGIEQDRDPLLREARSAGEQLAASLLGGPIPVSVTKAPAAWPTGEPPRLLSQATNSTLLCPGEGVTVGMVREAIAHGATTVNDVKRRTRAAMASCQGRDCLWSIRALLAEAGCDWETPMTARPPATGITVAELADLATA